MQVVRTGNLVQMPSEVWNVLQIHWNKDKKKPKKLGQLIEFPKTK